MTVRKLTIGRLETPIHLVSCEFILRRVTSSNAATALGIDDVRAAAARIAAHIHRTPLLPSRSLSEKLGAEVRLKCENLQRAGSFKIRGAMNALLQLSDDERRRGVVAFSSGNHAQGVALAAKTLGIQATIVMPENSVASKVAATRGYGAEVVQGGVTAATRDTVAREIAERTGAAVIPPFDDEVLLDATKYAMYRTKLVIEPTGALGVAALLSGSLHVPGRVAVVVSGGNLDFSLLC